jgi:tryptophan synthase alpha chain
MLEGGADAIEIGVPFSDPIMDGPVIQQTGARALAAGATPALVLELASSVRDRTDRPIILMTYYNPVFRYGLEKFAADCSLAGVDALVVPDLPVEEMEPLKAACGPARIDTVGFCAPTSSPERIESAARMSTGFLYCISILGTTGVRDSLPYGLGAFLTRVRRHASCPITVGLGISTPRQCSSVGEIADGVIVGSALMKALLENDAEPRFVRRLVRAMAQALHRENIRL